MNIPAGIPPVCRIPGCQHGAQVYSMSGGQLTYLKTCRRHCLDDLLAEKERQKRSK